MQQQTDGGLAVPPGAAGLLRVRLQRARGVVVDDEAHVIFVHAHAKSHRRHHHAHLAAHEAVLQRVALGRPHTGMIGARVDACLA